MLTLIGQPILLWNVFRSFPLTKMIHAQTAGTRLRNSIRCREILITVLEWLKPTTIVALGADAEAAVTSIGHECHRVRHPSYGGQAEFARNIADIYGPRAALRPQ